MRARPLERVRPRRGTHRARSRRRVAESGRNDARRRRRRRDRGHDGARRGRVAAPWAARAADDGGRGGRAGGRERTRPGARHRLDPHQPRQRGGRPPDGGVCRQHRYVDPDRRRPRAARRRCRDAFRHGERRSRRPLRVGHRPRTVECGQGSRAGSARGADDGSLPAGLPVGWQEPQRDPARRDRDLRRLGRPRAGLPDCGRRRGRNHPRRVREDRPGRLDRRRRRRGLRRSVDRRGDGRAARCRRSRADRAARAEPRLRRSRRDEHLPRGGDHGGRPADAAQPLALVERLGAPRGDRRPRRCRPSRRWRARGQAQLRRLAPESRFARARRSALRLRAPPSGSRRS